MMMPGTHAWHTRLAHTNDEHDPATLQTNLQDPGLGPPYAAGTSVAGGAPVPPHLLQVRSAGHKLQPWRKRGHMCLACGRSHCVMVREHRDGTSARRGACHALQALKEERDRLKQQVAQTQSPAAAYAPAPEIEPLAGAAPALPAPHSLPAEPSPQSARLQRSMEEAAATLGGGRVDGLIGGLAMGLKGHIDSGGAHVVGAPAPAAPPADITYDQWCKLDVDEGLGGTTLPTTALPTTATTLPTTIATTAAATPFNEASFGTPYAAGAASGGAAAGGGAPPAPVVPEPPASSAVCSEAEESYGESLRLAPTDADFFAPNHGDSRSSAPVGVGDALQGAAASGSQPATTHVPGLLRSGSERLVRPALKLGSFRAEDSGGSKTLSRRISGVRFAGEGVRPGGGGGRAQRGRLSYVLRGQWHPRRRKGGMAAALLLLLVEVPLHARAGHCLCIAEGSPQVTVLAAHSGATSNATSCAASGTSGDDSCEKEMRATSRTPTMLFNRSFTSQVGVCSHARAHDSGITTSATCGRGSLAAERRNRRSMRLRRRRTRQRKTRGTCLLHCLSHSSLKPALHPQREFRRSCQGADATHTSNVPELCQHVGHAAACGGPSALCRSPCSLCPIHGAYVQHLQAL